MLIVEDEFRVMSATDKESMVRMGLVGAGDFGCGHLQTLAALGEARSAAVVDIDPARLVSISEVPTWTDLTLALREVEVDGWIVAASTGSHVSVATTLLEAGYPVLLEKPIAPSLAEAEQLGSLVAEDSSNLMLGHIVLFDSEFQALRRDLEGRTALRHVCCHRMRSDDHLERYPGESPLFLIMVHDLYLVHALTGGAEPVAMSAQRRVTENGETDLVLAQLTFPNGMLANFSSGFVTPSTVPDTDYDRMELYGGGWAACLDLHPWPFEHRVGGSHPPSTRGVPDDSAKSPGMRAEELRCFCRVVRGEEPVPVGARYEDGMQLMRWMQALHDLLEDEHAG